jgi:O-antigen/teichoic acid export membrane protein
MLHTFKQILRARSNLRAHFWQTLANYCQTAGGLAMGIVLARLLDPAVFGELVLITATLTFFMIPLSFSAAQLLVSDGGRTASLFERVMGMVWLITAMKASALIAYLVWALMHGNLRAATVGFLVGLPLVAADWLVVIRSDLEGRGQFKPNFIVQLSGIFVNAVCSIVLVYYGWGIYGIAVGGLLGFLPQLCIYLLATDRIISCGRFDCSIMREQFTAGFWLWLAQVAEGWFARVDKIILGRFGGDVQLGYYNRALNFGPLSHIALNSLMTNATVVGLSNQPTEEHRWRLLRKTCFIVFAGALVNWFVWFWFSDPLVVWIFGSHWAGAIPGFQAFSWLSLAYASVYVPATLLLSYRAFRSLALCRIAGLSLFVCMLWWMQANSLIDSRHVAWSFCASLFFMGLLITATGCIMSLSLRAFVLHRE